MQEDYMIDRTVFLTVFPILSRLTVSKRSIETL